MSGRAGLQLERRPPSILDAVYLPTDFPDLAGNPIFEALPRLGTDKQIFASFSRLPTYSISERAQGDEYRRACVDRLDNYFEALPQHLPVCKFIFDLIRTGYVYRRPHEETYHKQINERYHAAMHGGFVPIEKGVPATASAITISGLSGTGKSNAVERTLNYLPPALRHPKFGIVQIPAIKIDCPSKGNLKQFALRIIEEVDSRIDSPYRELCKNMSADELKIPISRILETHFVGVLVIDEFQNLARFREGRESVLAFLVSLSNLVKVPIAFVGTPLVEGMMGSVFAGARRCGPNVKTSPLASRTWKFFCESMWKYQWVKNPAPICGEILSVLFELTQGIPALANLLFRLAQKEVIGRSETVTAERLRLVSDQYFGLVQPMICALKRNCEADLLRFEDLYSKSMDTMRKAAAVAL